MSKTAEINLWTFWDRMRGAIDGDDYITATVLVDGVKNALKEQHGKQTPDQVYTTLLTIADKIGVRNPFHDKDGFFFIYQEGKNLNKTDWEEAIAKTMTSSRVPILSAPIIEIFSKRFQKKPKTVLIAEAERFVPNLQHIIDENINTTFVITSKNISYIEALQNAFKDYENVEILQTDIYEYEFTNKRFDLILSCPIFGGRTLIEDTTFMCREFDMVALENLLLHLNSGGDLEIVLPGRITFASGKVNDLRQFIQQNYSIREIAELPEGTIEFVGIKMYLLHIENTRPQDDDDIVVRRYKALERRNRKSAVTTLEIDEDTFVMLGELEEQGNWSVDKIFSQQDEAYLNYQNSGVRKDFIGNVAQIFRGKAVSRKDPAGNISVVNISNIGEYDVNYENLEHMDEEERKVANYLLQEGDVLLPARGTAIRTAVFRQQKYPCIASSNVIVIRPDDKLLHSTYLKIFLDSPIGNKLISSTQQGTTMMNISYKDLNILEIPLPSMEEQQAIVKEYKDELEKYKETINAAQKRWNEVRTKLQRF